VAVATPRPPEVPDEPGSLGGAAETLLRVRPLAAEIAHHQRVQMHPCSPPVRVVTFDVERYSV